MKKWILLLLVLLSGAIAAVYLFIPGKITIRASANIAANKEGLYRKLSNPAAWPQWWPGDKTADSSGAYLLGNTRFRPGAPLTLSLPFSISDGSLETGAELTFLALGTDSSTLQLDAMIPGSGNPFQRISAYYHAKKIKEQLNTLLESISRTYSAIAAVYDYDIQKRSVTDSNLIFIATEIKTTPDPAFIYSLAGRLKKYALTQKAAETGFPMLNVFTRDSVHYLVKLALPVDRKMPDSGDIHYRWMLGGGNILVTEVRGGPAEIRKAYGQILNYVNDYKRIAPAIPFESLVTDRQQEKDSSKWITRICYPVM
ncbi:MAG: GyrI-like domain-containing protein [Sphingobacteriales bacterium]|nr:GyrI-like domain-containing protein [Sphingobacteriales bacterium]